MLFYAWMKKLPVILLSSLLLLFSFPKMTSASLLLMDKDGRVVWNVLSMEDEIESSIEEVKEEVVDTEVKEVRPESEIEIKSINNVSTSVNANKMDVEVSNEDGRVNLRVKTTTGETNTDVTGFQGEMVEIEERSEAQKVKISVKGENLEIQSKGVGALTSYPISVNSETNELTVTTPSGKRIVSILPSVAVSYVLSSNTIDKVGGTDSVILDETSRGELNYKISGVKDVRLFETLSFSVPVVARVSATTGEILNIEKPIWLKVLGFAFSN